MADTTLPECSGSPDASTGVRRSTHEPLPEPPEGPPNIILRTGMKVPPTREMVLRGEVRIAGRLPDEPDGPPNIIVRTGMKIPAARERVLRGEVKIRVR